MKTHAELASDNWQQAQMPDGPVPLSGEWRVTMFFYAAVHATNHLLFPDGYAPADYRHDKRRSDVLGHKTLRPVGRAYTRLEDLSTIARYKPFDHPMRPDQLQSARLWAGEILRRAGILTP